MFCNTIEIKQTSRIYEDRRNSAQVQENAGGRREERASFRCRADDGAEGERTDAVGKVEEQ